MFKENFSIKVYESRFKFKNRYTSIVLLDKNESEILARMGFKVHKAMPKYVDLLHLDLVLSLMNR